MAFLKPHATGKTDVAVVFFNQHWQRLTTALNLVEIDIPYAANDILAACQHLISTCSLKIIMISRSLLCCALRQSRKWRTRSFHQPGCETKLVVNSRPPPATKVSISARQHPMPPFKNLTSRIKSLSYMDNILARKAVQAGADEALLLNEKGYVSCAAAAFFVFENNRWVTPLISDGALDGIVREILNMSKLDGVPIIEESLTLVQVQEADHLFICNSLNGAVPVIEINGVPKENRLQCRRFRKFISRGESQTLSPLAQ